MRSRRRAFELGCRIAAFALLGWLIGTSIFPSRPIGVARASDASVAMRLPDWTGLPATTELHAELSRVPEPWVVDWLAALRRSGHVVHWSGSPSAALILAERVADPETRVRVAIAAPSGSAVAVADDASAIDTLHVAALGATLNAEIVVGRVHATLAGQPMSATPPAPVSPRAVYVLGRAGWEGKYLVAALEERGWPVVARFAVAPGVDVTQGAPALDTSRVGAVIALDSTVDRLGDALARYVRRGGGVILAGDAAAASNVRAIAPGTPGVRTRVRLQPAQSIALGTTGFYPVTGLARDAVALDEREGAIAVAARRVESGRVMQIGYDDTWRWRMAGAEGSVAAHRAWWSRVVEAAAYVPGQGTAALANGEAAAPLAAMVDRLGAAASVVRPSPAISMSRVLLLILMMICLLAEWSSRRLRGLR